MKVLITGANGFLGTSLVHRLLSRGDTDIRCFVRPGSRHTQLEAMREQNHQANLELFVGTLTSADRILPALEGIDVVYHLAAGTSGTAADLFLNSVVASKHLLEAIVKHGSKMKVVLVSSFSVYGTANLPRNTVIDEKSPLEKQPARRDAYAYSKLRQEKLFWEYQKVHGFPLTVLRPGVIYGPGGTAMSSRVGLRLPGIFLHLGGSNTMPLTYVDNCADAIALAGRSERANGQTYNICDDNLPSCRQYLKRYKREVERLRSIRVPYFMTRFLSWTVERYSIRSKGQLPAFLTPYRTATTWKGMRFSNAKLKELGWRPAIDTQEGMRRTFEFFRAKLDAEKARLQTKAAEPAPCKLVIAPALQFKAAAAKLNPQTDLPVATASESGVQLQPPPLPNNGPVYVVDPAVNTHDSWRYGPNRKP
jgi:nucleoside-diphosphate-sugar epimerase